MKGKLKMEWHGVPAGTELNILDRRMSFGKLLLKCERVDGGSLPGPWGKGLQAEIMADFVEEG